MRRPCFVVLFAFLFLTVGCSDDPQLTDSGVVDAAGDSAPIADGGVDDTGQTDSSVPVPDATGDAIARPDAGPDACVGCDAAVPDCGNGVCGDNEDCVSCAIDCGSCPLTWTAQVSGQTVGLEAVDFPINAAVGFAVGQAGTIVATTNGGDDWVTQSSGTSATLRAVIFADEQNGYAAGDAGTIVKTTNGGATWIALATITNTSLRAIEFVDPQIGHTVGAGGVVMSTQDGGTNWSVAPSLTTEPLYALDFVDVRRGFVVGGGGVVLRTSNGGASWTKTTFGGAQTLRGVAFARDALTGFAVGDGGMIIKTTNGGNSWTRLSSGTTANLWGVDFSLDGLHGHVVGDHGLILRTLDGGVNWQREDPDTASNLRGVVFRAHWTRGYAVGANGTVVKRVPDWEPSIVYDTEVANLAPPSLLPNADPMLRRIFAVNSRGYLFALRPADRIAMYPPVLLSGEAKNRGPVGGLPAEPSATIFLSTSGGIGYAVDSATGIVRWETDADAQAVGVQPLGDALVASPVVSPSRNLAYFATRNAVGSENRLFAFAAKEGTCEWVVNGDCNDGMGTLNLGRIGGAPVHDVITQRLYLASTSLGGTGHTVWAIDASDAGGGTVVWSRDVGGSEASPAFVETTRDSVFVGTTTGRIYRLGTTDGLSCWSQSGSGCGDLVGNEEFFCTSTDTRTNTCSDGAGIVFGFFVLRADGIFADRTVFLATDGHLRMIDANGQLVWKTTAPIDRATFPVVVEDAGDPPSRDAIYKIYLGSGDGHLHELDLATGSETAVQQVGDGQAVVGSPTYDWTAQQIYVGTGFGKLHGYGVPF